MAYQRTEYQREREVNRDDDRDQNKSGGWKSWFGLGDNKDRDEDRDYNYKSTTSYRAENPSYGYSGQRSIYPERTGYSGAVSTGYSGPRGGYGYTTSDEVNRGPSWNADRDYNTRASYGQANGDRDVYKQESRSYGGQDRDYRPFADNTTRSYTPSRSYGFSGDYCAGRGDYGRDYAPSRDYTASRYQSDRDYTPTNRGFGGDRDYSYSRTYTTGGDRDYGYSRSNGFGGPEPASRSYGYGDSSRGYSAGYAGAENCARPSYQQSSYRY